MPFVPTPSVVLAKRVYVSASGAFEMKTFVPDSRYPFPSGSARKASAPASVPADGSVRAKAATASPRATGPANRLVISSEPASTIG